MIKTFIITFLIFFNLIAFAGKYGEHREIGNKGFYEAVKNLVQSDEFIDSIAVNKFLYEHFNISFDSEYSKFVFNTLSHPPNLISYGELTGLSGDHSTDPLSLEESLRYEFSKINKIVRMHDKAKEDFGIAANDTEIFNVDASYGLLAIVDQSHFYEYGNSFHDHFNRVNIKHIIDLELPKNVERVFSELRNSNAIAKYVTLHSVAIVFAQQAAFYLKEFGKLFEANTLLHYALMYNAFADHYLQDAFSSGHLPVRRSILGSVINNKPVHDFYGDVGLDVFNLRSQIWRMYGDGKMNSATKEWVTQDDYWQLPSDSYTMNYRLAIEATTLSVTEVLNAFNNGLKGEQENFYESIPSSEKYYSDFFIHKFEALSLIPVPYNSNLDNYSFDQEELPQLRRQNKLIPFRTYVVPRVANAFAFIYGWSLNGADGSGNLGLRFHTTKWYSYESVYDKQGTVDQWFEYNASFEISDSKGNGKIDTYQYKLGLGYKLDWWMFSSRHIGFYVFAMTGLQHQEDDRLMFSTQFVLDIAPLIGIDYAALPWWLGIPLHIILPFQIGIQTDYVWNRPPSHYITRVVDLVY